MAILQEEGLGLVAIAEFLASGQTDATSSGVTPGRIMSIEALIHFDAVS